MTSARIQAFCEKLNISIGCFDGTRRNHRCISQRKRSLFIYNIHFCLTWKSTGLSFNQAKEDLKTNFKIFDDVISDKQFKILLYLNMILKKVQSPLTKIVCKIWRPTKR